MKESPGHEPETSDSELEHRKVWDLPTRLFHWALVVTFATGYYLGEFRDFSTINLHFYAGYTVGGLLVFRILYGLFGPREVRLSGLFPSPKRVFEYLRHITLRRPSGVAGHNPIGALSVLAMLLALAVQVVTGLCSEDDAVFSEGPLAKYLSSGMVVTMTGIHHTSSKVLLALIGLHVAAIVFYAVWKRENLVRPMITGWKRVRRDREG